MNAPKFSTFFEEATGNAPYDYQSRLAGGDAGRSCESQLISIPTGLGKTAAVVLAWLWNRVHLHREDWPRRLVICLPMRTLVEQTCGEAQKWLANLAEKYPTNADLQWLVAEKHSPILLMGGEEAGEWDIHPERPAIIIGTQDMLLSRALNRGYGMARARWPMHFGLLNNDALWTLDETQLMGVGVRTSAQLQGLREKLGIAAPCVTWWASATLDSRLLQTPDYRTLPDTLALGPQDLENENVTQRIAAIKRLAALPLTLTSDSAKVVDPYIAQLAASVVKLHQGATTIVILNRVDRAKDLSAALDQLAKKQPLPRRILVHSRFRPLERAPLSRQIKEDGEKIIIATQAIEAGVDIGRALNNQADYTANFFGNYNFSTGKLKGINLGGGASFVGRRIIGNQVPNAFDYIKAPAYYTATATVGYTFKLRNRNLKLQLNVNNLLDYRDPYYTGIRTLNGRNYRDAFYYIDPRKFVLSTTVDL